MVNFEVMDYLPNTSELMDCEPMNTEFTSPGPTQSMNYCGGRIVRLKMVNFMTYDSREIIPGPGLNLIVGPNGSGKSTVVCAICLVLGGKPTFTGRKMQLADFVKHGKTRASVEIELECPNDGRNLVIQRQINANGTSQYFLHGIIVKENAIEREVSRFNIQVNNLCQFLPQERVSEFSKMNSIQLLESMQQAVGDQSLFQTHDELKKLTDENRDLVEQIRNKQDYVSSEKKKNQRLETEVQIYEEIQRHTNHKKLLTEKLAVLQYKEMYQQMNLQKEKGKDILEELKKVEATLSPVRAELQTAETNVRANVDKVRKLTSMHEVKKKKLNEISSKIRANDDQIYEAEVSFKHKLMEQSNRHNRVKVIESQLRTFQDDLRTQKERKVSIEAEMENIESETAKVINMVHDKELAVDEITASVNYIRQRQQEYQKQLVQLSGMEQRKLQVLKKLDEPTFKAFMWLKENRHKFKKTIFDPMLMLIEIPDDQSVKFVENHISFRDLIAFMCEDKSDSEVLVGKLRKEMNLAINVVLAPSKHPSEYKPEVPLPQLKSRYHLKAYIKDLIKAPDPIISFLCENYNIHNTPVGDRNTERYLEGLLNSAKFRKVYMTDDCYTITRSQYGARHVSILNSTLRKPTILSTFNTSSDQQIEIENCLKELDEQLHAEKSKEQVHRKELQELHRSLEELRKRKKACKEVVSMIKNLQWQIVEKEKSLQIARDAVFDISEEERKTKAFIKEKKEEKVLLMGKIHNLLWECAKHTKECIRCQLLSCSFWKKKNVLRNKLQEMGDSSKTLKTRYAEAERLCEEMRKEAMKKLREASIIIRMDIKKSNESQLEERYGHLPNTIEEVNSEIHKLTAKIDCLGESNQSAFDEHQRRKRDILQAEHSLEDLQSKLNSVKAKLELKKQLWLTPLESLVKRISLTFSEYFEIMGCAGEIILKHGEDPDNFHKYGLSIQVKFRGADPLMELSHSHHSGGECSVSTIIFILSLQKLTVVPFRCVDEINQGMDSVNERRIFDLVAKSAENSSQYFLLTPKLLRDLPYPETISVHIIYNAPGLQESVTFNISTILKNLAATQGRNESE